MRRVLQYVGGHCSLQFLTLSLSDSKQIKRITGTHTEFGTGKSEERITDQVNEERMSSNKY